MKPSFGTVLCTLGFVIVKITRDLHGEETQSPELIKMTTADEIVTGRDLSSLSLKTLKGFVIFSPIVNKSESWHE